MKMYLIKADYTAEGTKGLMQEGGTSRKKMVENMLAELGGRVESFYYTFGNPDVYLIIELPDDISGAATRLRVNASGLVNISVTPLLSPEDIDAASNKSVNYRGPGEK